MMRVVHFIAGVDASHGGPAIALAGLVPAQVRAGLDVDVVAWARAGADPKLIAAMQRAGATVNVVTYRDQRRWQRLASPQRLREAVDDAVARADVCHIHGLWEPIQHIAARCALQRSVPYLLRPCGLLGPWPMRHHRWRKRFYYAWRMRRHIERAAALHYATAVERDTARLVPQGIPAIVEPHGVDEAAFAQRPGAVERQSNGRQVLFLGRLHPMKGLDLLIPAFAAATPADAHLCIAGPDREGYAPALQRLARSHGVERRVRFAGMVEGAEKFALLAAADVLALPSRYENFGLVVIEALAAGTPAVISDQVATWRDLVPAGVAAAVPLRCKPLAKRLSCWLNAPEHLQRLGERARCYARKHHNQDVIAQRWCAHYDRIVRGPRRAMA